MKYLPTPAAWGLAALAAFSLSVSAQTLPTRKAGLWEIRMEHLGGPMAEAQKQMEQAMASMSPAQRKQMEEMMRAQGVSLGDKGRTMRMCLSAAAAARESGAAFTNDPDDDCTHKITPVSASEAKFSFTCKGGSQARGEGRLWAYTAQGFQAESTIQMKEGGKPVTMQVRQSGRWLGTDCQGLKPIE